MSTLTRTSSEKVTLYLPSDLLAAADRAVKVGGLRSRNELVARGLQRMIQDINRAAIDAAFDAAGQDADYQTEDLAIMKEFESADIEAVQRGELD